MLFSVFKLTCWIHLTFLPQTDCLISVCTLHCLVTLNQVLSAQKGRQTPRSGYLWTPGPHPQLFYLNQVGAGSCPGHNLSPSGPPWGNQARARWKLPEQGLHSDSAPAAGRLQGDVFTSRV